MIFVNLKFKLISNEPEYGVDMTDAVEKIFWSLKPTFEKKSLKIVTNWSTEL